MCGIAGIVDFTRPSEAHRGRAEAMRRALRHRGPDGEGEHTGAHVALGHTRLAILDIEGGAQPMVSPDDRFVVVFNGELANADELRSALDWRFRTRSDTEVVLAAYARWGAACPARLSGMFAFFAWDAAELRGFGARDRLGVKPFVFAHEGEAFLFASEAQAIARTARSRPRVNVPGVLEVLVAPCFSGVAHTMFEGIRPLLPGHALTVDRAGARIEAYWDWPCSAAREADPARIVSALRDEVPAAVQRALVSDVPLGVFSSGGLDSSIIAATMAERSPAPVPAYTVTFDDQAAFDYGRSMITNADDTPYARAVARSFGMDARWVHVPRSEIGGALAEVARANDALPAWEQEIAQHRLAHAAARSLKAVVVGDAADETHFGYHFLLDPEAVAGPHVILSRLGSVPVRRSIAEDPAGGAARDLVRLAESAGGRFDTPEGRILATTYLIVRRWLPRLLHNGDIHTMHASLEARVPFADARLVDLAASVSPEVGLRFGTEKWALREAVRGSVPEQVRTRKKSALPKDLAVETIYRAEAMEVLREPPSVVRELVDIEAASRLVARPSALTEAERAILFRIVTLAHWSNHHGVSGP
jgi:asparagine synthase (glutamine-hydrolysing)